MQTVRENSTQYMLRAIELAKKGLGKVSPNPAVGCVIVKKKRILAEGFHKKFGAAHAEIEALKRVGPAAKGACLYVTLEPCAHFGKTPPCVDSIIKSGIKEVVIAMGDPNPVNNGQGIKMLRAAGVKIKQGVCRREAENLNTPFIKYMKKEMPYVTLKMAQSLDGKIATRTGDSGWVSCNKSRLFVHQLRKEMDAIMIGVGTLLKDNPLLRTHAPGRQPFRIIVDSKLKTPLNSRIFSRKSPEETIIATTKLASKNKVKKFLKKGVDILFISGKNGAVSLKSLMKALAARGILNIMIEGGGELAASALKEGVVDKLLFFIAPKIIGGKDAKTPVEGAGIDKIIRAMKVKNITIKKIGCDFLFEGRV